MVRYDPPCNQLALGLWWSLACKAQKPARMAKGCANGRNAGPRDQPGCRAIYEVFSPFLFHRFFICVLDPPQPPFNPCSRPSRKRDRKVRCGHGAASAASWFNLMLSDRYEGTMLRLRSQFLQEMVSLDTAHVKKWTRHGACMHALVAHEYAPICGLRNDY